MKHITEHHKSNHSSLYVDPYYEPPLNKNKLQNPWGTGDKLCGWGMPSQ